jgi:alkylation response protein AidB-like acyl-CoA dehydrogenase
MMSDFGFSSEEEDIVTAVIRFVNGAVLPSVARYEREGIYPGDLVARMKELGLFGIAVPAEYGGLGLRLPVFAAVMEELAKGWTSLAAYVNSHSTVAYALALHGTPEQRAKYLPALATGEQRGALLLTEPHTGSDLKAIRTSAHAMQAHYRVSGQKFYVTNGGKATLLLTLVKHDQPAAPSDKSPISLLLLEKQTEGVRVASEFHKMGFGLVDTVEILITEAKVPKDQLLGGIEGRGFAQLMDALEVGRIAIAASAVGLAAAALSEAKRFAESRRTFGVTIDQHQAIQLRMAEMATQLVAARLITQEAARIKQKGGRSDMITGMAKLFASEACQEIALASLRTHGGAGYIVDSPIERLFREAPLYLIGEGTNDINKIVIARRMSGDTEKRYLGLLA